MIESRQKLPSSLTTNLQITSSSRQSVYTGSIFYTSSDRHSERCIGGTSSRVSVESFLRLLSAFSALYPLLVAKYVTLLLGPFSKVTGYAVLPLGPVSAVQPKTIVCRTLCVQPIIRLSIVVGVRTSLISQKVVRLSAKQVS